MPLETDGNLPVQSDPKLAWARHNLAEKPIEINQAGKQELLRIPGIGPKGAEAILLARRQGKLNALTTLKKLGILAERAAPFLLLNGHRPVYQPALL